MRQAGEASRQFLALELKLLMVGEELPGRGNQAVQQPLKIGPIHQSICLSIRRLFCLCQ